MRLYMPDDRASAVKNIQRLLKINKAEFMMQGQRKL